MYQIKCDDYILYDPRDEDLIVLNPKCKMGVNTVGEGSFTILNTHPYYDKIKKLKSVFEITQNGQTIFRGRMVNDSVDIYNRLTVDLEGVLGYTNDTLVAPFAFPGGFPDTTGVSNIVEFFLATMLAYHNGQVEEWQKLKLGRVTVRDPNNYIARSSTEYMTTWEVLKTKLFESNLGGYLVIRYEDDGNYVDYLTEFDLTNTQPIVFGENLLDIVRESNGTSTCSAILPLGAELERENGTKYTLTLDELPDGDLTDDLVKQGKYIYSKSAREAYGWICVSPNDSRWDDVTLASNLQTKAMAYLTDTATLFSGTITIKAVDLSFTDEEIQSFRVYRNVLVSSEAHGLQNVSYPLTQLEIDILNPQNTVISIGDTRRSMLDMNARQSGNMQNDAAVATIATEENTSEIAELKNQITLQRTQLISACNEIILAALESYVETSNLEEYKNTVSTQLQILADEIVMNFTNVTEHITNVDGDLQSRFTEIYKYISFENGNITLGSNENAITLTIENDMIVFKRNGLQFGWWDGVDFHTGNIVVEVNKRAQLGNFAFVPRSDGSLMFLKVGG